MSYIDALIYGLIQGLSEFLPVSSSGHLALLPHFLTIEDPGVSFDLMMHLGTAFAVIIYFRRDLLHMCRNMLNLKTLFNTQDKSLHFERNFIFATVVSIFFILLFLYPSKLARSTDVIIFNLVIFGVVMWISEIINKKKDKSHELSLKSALIIGAFQAVAIFPGVSRSGITISVALLLGMSRESAGKFSFLLSLPIILLGALKELPKLFSETQSISLGVLSFGMLISFLVGLLTIHLFLSNIKKFGLYWFSLYRFIIAGLVYFYL